MKQRTTHKQTAILAATLLAAVLVVAGCSIQGQSSQAKAPQIVAKMTYVKDAHGLCYATVGISTGPCETADL